MMKCAVPSSEKYCVKLCYTDAQFLDLTSCGGAVIGRSVLRLVEAATCTGFVQILKKYGKSWNLM